MTGTGSAPLSTPTAIASPPRSRSAGPFSQDPSVLRRRGLLHLAAATLPMPALGLSLVRQRRLDEALASPGAGGGARPGERPLRLCARRRAAFRRPAARGVRRAAGRARRPCRRPGDPVDAGADCPRRRRDGPGAQLRAADARRRSRGPSGAPNARIDAAVAPGCCHAYAAPGAVGRKDHPADGAERPRSERPAASQWTSARGR
jgi:hypothetical protein